MKIHNMKGSMMMHKYISDSSIFTKVYKSSHKPLKFPIKIINNKVNLMDSDMIYSIKLLNLYPKEVFSSVPFFQFSKKLQSMSNISSKYGFMLIFPQKEIIPLSYIDMSSNKNELIESFLFTYDYTFFTYIVNSLNEIKNSKVRMYVFRQLKNIYNSKPSYLFYLNNCEGQIGGRIGLILLINFAILIRFNPMSLL